MHGLANVKFSGKIVVKIKTEFYIQYFYPKSCCSYCGKRWWSHTFYRWNIIWCRKITIFMQVNGRRIHKHTHTHLEYLKLIVSNLSNFVWFRKMFYGSANLINCETTYMSVRFLQPNCTPQTGHDRTNILLFQCNILQYTWRPTYILLLPATQICHESIVVLHSVLPCLKMTSSSATRNVFLMIGWPCIVV
jgi:hypothetical protein